MQCCAEREQWCAEREQCLKRVLGIRMTLIIITDGLVVVNYPCSEEMRHHIDVGRDMDITPGRGEFVRRHGLAWVHLPAAQHKEER